MDDRWPPYPAITSEHVRGARLFANRSDYEREMAPFAASVTIVEGDSRQTLRPCADRSFDLVYIDGNHDHAFVKSDAELGAEMVKDAGFLVFNDYMLIDHNHANYGIVPVVNDMVVNHGWQVVGFALDQHLYCDIALQRRTATTPAEPPVVANRPSFMKRLFGG